MAKLEVSVIGCTHLKDTEMFSRQDPYVSIHCGSEKFTTKTHTDGGVNPTFNEKFPFNLSPVIKELSCSVMNSNSFSRDNIIGEATIPLATAMSSGYEDLNFPLKDERGRGAGYIRLILRVTHLADSKPSKVAAPPLASANQGGGAYPMSAPIGGGGAGGAYPGYGVSTPPHVQPYGVPPSPQPYGVPPSPQPYGVPPPQPYGQARTFNDVSTAPAPYYANSASSSPLSPSLSIRSTYYNQPPPPPPPSVSPVTPVQYAVTHCQSFQHASAPPAFPTGAPAAFPAGGRVTIDIGGYPQATPVGYPGPPHSHSPPSSASGAMYGQPQGVYPGAYSAPSAVTEPTPAYPSNQATSYPFPSATPAAPYGSQAYPSFGFGQR